jgi:magnesium transporter
MEKQITLIEEDLINSRKQDYVKDIFTYRKKLMLLKKYYQQLADIMDDLYQNEAQNIVNKRYIKRISDKSKRLYADCFPCSLM